MSNESAPECIRHHDHRNIQTRLDYMLLYQNETKAKVIRILETWTNTHYAEWHKAIADSKEQGAEPPQEDLWITMSYDQFALFAYGTMQHDNIKQSVDELVKDGHIKRRPHPEFPYGPPQYLLNRDVIQDALNKLDIPTSLFDLVGLFVSPRKKHTPQEKNPQGGGIKTPRVGGKIPPGWGDFTPPSNNYSKKHPKKHTENTEGESAIAPPARSPAQEIDFDPETTQFYQNYLRNCELAKERGDPPPPRPAHMIVDGASDVEETVKRAAFSSSRDGYENETHSQEGSSDDDTRYSRPGDLLRHHPHRVAGGVSSDKDAVASPEMAVAQQTSSALSHGAAPAEFGQASDGAASAGALPPQSASTAPRASDEAVAIMDAWDSLWKRPQPRTKKHIAAATALVPSHPSRDDLKACKDWLFTTDNPSKPWFGKKGVSLQDVADNYTAWQSVLPDETAEPEEYTTAWFAKYYPEKLVGYQPRLHA